MRLVYIVTYALCSHSCVELSIVCHLHHVAMYGCDEQCPTCHSSLLDKAQTAVHLPVHVQFALGASKRHRKALGTERFSMFIQDWRGQGDIPDATVSPDG
jgi:hypothetical protein